MENLIDAATPFLYGFILGYTLPSLWKFYNKLVKEIRHTRENWAKPR